jgi:SAM-dependent methyltransferase
MMIRILPPESQSLMHESSKSVFHKLKDSRYATRYLTGDGIDIGAGADSIAQYYEFFPLMRSCRAWDLPDGDAQYMQGVADNSLDFVHSSHCLEHLRDPIIALENWVRILKPGGHLICLIPDEDLYEQGVFPSTFNADHKHTFTIYKKGSWSAQSINLFDLLSQANISVQIKKMELLDATYRYQIQSLHPTERFDQTNTPIGECAIEFILKKC